MDYPDHLQNSNRDFVFSQYHSYIADPEIVDLQGNTVDVLNDPEDDILEPGKFYFRI